LKGSSETVGEKLCDFQTTRSKDLSVTIVEDQADGVKSAEVIRIDDGKVRQHVEVVVNRPRA